MAKNQEARKTNKLAKITFHSDYGGVYAWCIDEYFNGEKSHQTKVLKREYFDDLTDVILEYCKQGWKVEVEPSKDVQIKS